MIAARCQNNSTSEEKSAILDELVLQDFPPFMASFRKQKADLSPEAKQAALLNGMEQCKSHELMPGLIERMFNFKLEEEVLEREIFSVPDMMPLVFNYMDLFFQTHQGSTEESYKKAAKMMRDLCKYYDKNLVST